MQLSRVRLGILAVVCAPLASHHLSMVSRSVESNAQHTGMVRVLGAFVLLRQATCYQGIPFPRDKPNLVLCLLRDLLTEAFSAASEGDWIRVRHLYTLLSLSG